MTEGKNPARNDRSLARTCGSARRNECARFCNKVFIGGRCCWSTNTPSILLRSG